jgi:hypothetical protein
MHFTLADLVTDITQNAAESGADQVELEIRETGSPEGRGEFRFTVRDNGKGMSPEEARRAVDPFVSDGVKHPHRKVGLGIPFLIQTAEQSGGGWEIRSAKAGQGAVVLSSAGERGDEGPGAVPGGGGTTVSAWFDLRNVDTPPAGDLSGMFRTVLLFSGPGEICLRRLREGEGAELSYEVRKSELLEALGGFEDTGSLILLDRYLKSLET